MMFLDIDILHAMANEIAALNQSSLYKMPHKYRQLRHLQQTLARNFGNLHGWTLSTTPIALKQLAEGARNRSLDHCIGSRD